MTLDEFERLVKRLATGPDPDKKVMGWPGSRSELESRVPAAARVSLDLHELAVPSDGEELPKGDQRVARYLIERIRRAAQVHKHKSVRGRVFIVTGLDLLVKYQTGLTVFYEEVNDDRTACVLVVEPVKLDAHELKRRVPYIHCNPMAVWNEIVRLLDNDKIIRN